MEQDLEQAMRDIAKTVDAGIDRGEGQAESPEAALDSSLIGVGPDDLNVRGLLERLSNGIEELIIATNPSVEGEATATYLHRLVASTSDASVTRLARGLPVGGDLEYADGVTIAEAFSGRREM